MTAGVGTADGHLGVTCYHYDPGSITGYVLFGKNQCNSALPFSLQQYYCH